MNTLTAPDGRSYPFSTVEELKATPLFREAVADPAFTGDLAYNRECLMAAKLIEGKTVFCLVGRLEKSVALPSEIRLEKDEETHVGD